MAIFESIDQTTDQAISKSEAFIRNSEAYYELKLFQMLSSSLALLVKFTIIGALSLIALVLLSISLSSYLGQLLGSIGLGYSITAMIYVLLAFVVYRLRVTIENRIIRLLSQKIFK